MNSYTVDDLHLYIMFSQNYMEVLANIGFILNNDDSWMHVEFVLA